MPDENQVETPETETTEAPVETVIENAPESEAPFEDKVEVGTVGDGEKITPPVDTTPVPGLKEIIIDALKEVGIGNAGVPVAVSQDAYAYCSITKLENGFIAETFKGKKFYTSLDEALVNVETSLRASFAA